MAEENTPRDVEQDSGLFSAEDKELIQRIREAGSFNIEGLSNSLRATPAARRLAKENHIDLESVQGSGPNGRIQEADVLAAVNPEREETAEAAEENPETAISAQEAEQELVDKVTEELKQQSGLNEGILETQMQDLVKSAIQEMVAENSTRPFESMDMPNPGMDAALDMSLEELVKNAGGDTETMEMDLSAASRDEDDQPQEKTTDTADPEELKTEDGLEEKDEPKTPVSASLPEAEDEEPMEKTDDVPDAKAAETVKATPLARKIAAVHHLDLTETTGSGSNGKITKADVLSMLNFQKASYPVISLAADADADAVLATIELLQKEALTYSLDDFIERACVCALEKFPNINGQASICLTAPMLINDSEIRLHSSPQCENRTFTEFVQLRQNSENNASVDEKPTFMVMNLGELGIVDFSDVIPEGMRAMLCVGKLKDTLYLENDEVKIRKNIRLRLNLRSESCNSAEGAAFLHTVCDFLENPERMM